jgi:phosphoribosyl 1,2-cyclic phosphodiesterase
MSLDFEIISTGSKGNCVVIDDIMFDCGVPFKRIKDYLYDVNVLLLTHIHSDHIKESTLKNIVVMFPHIDIYGNYEIAQVYSEYPIKVINAGVPFMAQNNILIEPFNCIHDVVTYGYTWNVDGRSIIYATDTSDLRHAPIKEYDYLFIESNHDEKKLEIMTSTRSYAYNVVAGAKRHMSTQTAKAFYYMNRRNKDAKFIELHQSSRFY